MTATRAFFGALTLILTSGFANRYQMRGTVRSIPNCRVTSIGLSIRQMTLQKNAGITSSMQLFGEVAPKRNGLGKPKGYWDAKSRYILEKHNLSGLPDMSKPFLVLGIESSCDDTGVAVVRSDGHILSNVVYSQYEIHQKFGGIVPGLAMEAHKGNIEKAVKEAIQQAGLSSVAEIDAIAVTRGPGLEICLRVGFQKAQALANEFQKPFVAVHHLEAHCVMARLSGIEVVREVEAGADVQTTVESGDGDSQVAVSNTVLEKNSAITQSTIDDMETAITSEQKGETLTDVTSEDSEMHVFVPKVEYPFLALLASGGHTSILLCKALGEYEIIGGTLDDALGEAFDKAARLLGLTCATSGGAAVENAALKGNKNSYPMTVPMRNKLSCDFSYSGLKNAFRQAVQSAREKEGLDVNSTNAPAKQMEESPEIVSLSADSTADLCASFQSVAFAHVVDRLKHAINYVEDNDVLITALVVVGGVAANKELRRQLLDLLESRAIGTDVRLTTIRSKKYPDEDFPLIVTKPISLIFPPPKLCTDNGVMVAWAGVEKLLLGISDEINGQEVVSRWPLGGPIDNGNATFRKGGLRDISKQ